MSKELEALNDLLLLSKLSDGAKKGMSALKRADYNAHIIYRALERAKKVEELKDLFMRLANNNYLMYQTDNPIFANKRTILLREINEKEKELGGNEMITTKEVKDELQYYIAEFGIDYYIEIKNGKHFPVTSEYLSQQEKKDKLLELYREHKKLVPFKTGLGKDSKRVIDISIEIKALEEEME